MFKFTFAIMVLLLGCNSCFARNALEDLAQQLRLISTNDYADVDFNRSRYDAGHLKQKSYALSFYRHWAPYAALETAIDVELDKVDLGVYQIRSRGGELRLIQHFQLNSFFEVGAGLSYSPQTRYTANQRELILPAKHALALSAKLNSADHKHNLTLEFTANQWKMDDAQTRWFDNGQQEQHLQLSYSASF